MTTIPVTTARLGWGNSRLRRDITRLVARAAVVVTAHVGPLPTTRITLTDFAGLLNLHTAEGHAFAPEASRLARWNADRQIRRSATEVNAGGVTLLDPDDGVHIAIDIRSWTPEEVPAVVVHELVHAVQLGTPDPRALHIAYIRSNYRLERWSNRQVDDYHHVMDLRETEAEQHERLAAHL